MKRGLLFVMVSVFICSLAISSIAAEVPGVTKDSITIGAIIDMTGPASYIMTQENYGALTYFDKAFAEGVYKRKIIVKAEDGGYEPGKHLAAGKLLLDRDNVFCFTYSTGTTSTLALNVLLEERKVPLLTPGAQSVTIANPYKRYLFNQMTTVHDQARLAVDYIVSKDPKAKVAIIHQEDDFGREGGEGFVRQMKKHGIEPVGIVTYPRMTKDWSSATLRLKSLNPDYVINHTIPVYGAAIMKEAHKLGWQPKWFVIAGTFNEWIKMAGSAMDYAGEVYGIKVEYPADSDFPGAVEFREAIKKYGPKDKTVVDYPGIVGYGHGKIVVEALKRAEAKNNLTREGIIDALETFKDFETGVFPPLSYTPTSHAGTDSGFLAKRAGDTWKLVTGQWIKPQ